MANSQDTNERLAQPEQEPVAWHHPDCQGECIACLIQRAVQDAYGTQGLDYLLRHVTAVATPLDRMAENARELGLDYEPVQEPLTEKRIEELYSFWVVDCQDIVAFARAIERHKAKPQMQPCAGRNCGSTNPNLHSAECFEDYEKTTGMVSQEPKCAVIVEVFGKEWRLDYMALPVGKHKLYTQQYTYAAPSQRKPLPPQSPCEMTQAENKMFKLGWLECEAAHGIKGEA